MKKITLVTLIVFIIGCNNRQIQFQNVSRAGPKIACPENLDDSELYRNTHALDFCFTNNVRTLLKSKQIFNKIKWLISKKDYKVAEILLKKAITTATHTDELKHALIDVYARTNKWSKAESLVNELEIKVNDPLRITIEARTGNFSEDTDFNLIPQIYKNKVNGVKPLRAVVVPDSLTYFDLTRVDNAGPGIPSAEPSIKVSNDGQNILVAWMDDHNLLLGYPIYQGHSAYSSDGGDTWENYIISPYIEQGFVSHFDMVTAYDPNNNFMYSGGETATTSFDSTTLDSFYIYRLDLDTGIQDGPFIIGDIDEFSNFDFDKILIAIKNTGELILTTYFPGEVKISNDYGETYTDVMDVPSGMAQPKFKDNCLYLLSQTSPKLWRCDLGTNEGNPTPASNNWWGYSEHISGNFYIHNLSYMDFHPNGDIYIIYSELKEVNGGEVVVWMSKSSNNGDSWDDAWIVTPDIPGDKFLPWIEIDGEGGIHISYNDTRNNHQPAYSDTTYLDMYYSHSSDEGQSWQETRVTPTSFELIDNVSYSVTYSDYLEMAIGNPEAVFLSFPWSPNSNDMDMYVAKKQKRDDLIFANNFEVE